MLGSISHSPIIPFLEPSFRGKKIALGVTGSIAATKSADLVRLLVACGAEVRVILTHGGSNFVTPLTLETLSGHPVETDLWNTHGRGTHHIDLARWADGVVVAPATAHFIAKRAQGFADDLLTTELLAFEGPVWIAPAMNPSMYQHAATRQNLKTIVGRGDLVLDPYVGLTSCGEVGQGRLLEPEEIAEHVGLGLSQIASRGRIVDPPSPQILISMGPTRSTIDPVRFISNRSSGKMGCALAWEARRRGFKTVVVAGPHQTHLPQSTVQHSVETTDEMATRVLQEFKMSQTFLSVAAVSDWNVQASDQKLKKEDGTPSIYLSPAIDILAETGAHRTSKQFILGFAAETRNVEPAARKKLRSKGCQAIFANDVSAPDAGMNSDQNTGIWIDSNGVQAIPKMSKTGLATEIWNRIEKALDERTTQTSSSSVEPPPPANMSEAPRR